LIDIALSFLLCRQQENEHPADFKKRLEEKADIFVSLLGDNILDEFVKTTPAHKKASSATAKVQLCKKAMDQWIALIAIRNSEPTKYSILKRNLNDDYSMGVDKFPTDLDSAVDILINRNKSSLLRANLPQPLNPRLLKMTSLHMREPQPALLSASSVAAMTTLDLTANRPSQPMSGMPPRP
jgi:transcription initiation factor IIF auxiliary subunit